MDSFYPRVYIQLNNYRHFHITMFEFRYPRKKKLGLVIIRFRCSGVE
jgi:hypothetical protein